MKKARVIIQGKEPYLFKGEQYEVVDEFKAPDLFDTNHKESSFVVVKDELGFPFELSTDSVEFVI